MRKQVAVRDITIHCPSMLRLGRRVMAAEGRLADGQGHATFDAHEASTFTVAESLSVCQQLLESSWKRFNSVHSNKIWNDALDSAIKGCKGLLNLATERQVRELESDKIYGLYYS